MNRFLFAAALVLPLCLPAPAADDFDRQFLNPPADARMASYLWSFGPAWTKDEIRRHLTLFDRAGIGRVLIYPLYPYEVDDPARGIRNLNYLSPEFQEMIGYFTRTAREMSMQADLVMGTGWPYGGPMIPEPLAPRRIIMHSRPVPGRAGESVTLAAGPVGENEDIIAVQLVPKTPGAAAQDLTAKLNAAREVSFTAPPGEWLLMTFLQSPTAHRHKVVYAAAGAGGNVIDHLDPRAVDLYLKEVGEKLAAPLQGNLRALYCPSMEVDGTAWTPQFLPEFRKRLGYDLAPHLSALFRDEGEKSLHIRRDYWDTIQQLAIDNYLMKVGNWIRARGYRFQAEAYGTPPVRLSCFSAVDYPMGEDCDWKQFNRTRWASAGAHAYSRNIVSVEAYTGLSFPARYNESLQDLKVASDMHFVCGANRMVMHGYAYSPKVVPSPGWGYYAGIMATEHSPWWPYFPLLSKYLQRTGYVLSLGVPVVDVALYLPEDDVFADSPPGYVNFIHVKYRLDRTKRRLGDNFGLQNAMLHETDVVKTILTSGYSLDGVDHSVLPAKGVVRDGKLVIGDAAFSTIVLPGLRGMPLEDLEKVAEFCRGGGTVIVTLAAPRMAYGFKDLDQRAARFRALAAELFGSGDRKVGQGRVLFASDERGALARALRAVPPDVEIQPATDEVAFVHRRVGAQDFYFLTNFSDRPKDLRVSFRAGARTPRLLDSMTGGIAGTTFEYQGDRTVAEIPLEPYGSTIVEFGARKDAPRRVPRDAPAGEAIAISSPWRVAFPDGKTVEMPVLKSWTEDPGQRFFSGKARYETTFDVPGPAPAPGVRQWLELGQVREIAEVWVNGKPAGTAWKLPYRLDVTPLVKAGRNTLRVDVSNLLINQVLNQPDKDYSDVEARYPIGTKVPRPREKQVVKDPPPSGLLGPVRIQATRKP